MRRDVQDIFRLTPHEKQCMMFSATLSKEIRPVCRKFMQDVSTPAFAGFYTSRLLKAILPVFLVSYVYNFNTNWAVTDPFFFQPMEVFVDDETKLTLHGLQQYYVKLKDSEKNRKLFDLLDVLEFNQVMSLHSFTACPGFPQFLGSLWKAVSRPWKVFESRHRNIETLESAWILLVQEDFWIRYRMYTEIQTRHF